MAIGGPSATRARTGAGGTSLLHFLRVLRFARPYYRYLFPGLACIVVVAVTYSVNIMALLPTIHLMDPNSQGVPSWMRQRVAERRLGIVLAPVLAENLVRVADIRRDSPLAGKVKINDALVALDGEQLAPAQIFRRLAEAEAGSEVRLRFDRAEESAGELTVRLGDVRFPDSLLPIIANWLPQGTGKDDLLATLRIVLVVIVSVSLVGGACRFFGEYLIALVAARTVVSMRKMMYQRVLRMPVSHFAVNGISDTVSRFVQDSQDVYRGLNFIFAKSLREPLKAMFVFLVALAIDWRITLITVFGAPLAAYLVRRMGKMIRKANKRLLENYGRMISTLESSLRGIRVVKGYTMETYERLRLHSVDKEMLRQQLKIERIDALSSPLFESIGQVVAALAILYFAQQMLEGRMEFAKFATLAVCMAGMFDPVRKMSSFYNRVQTANAAMDRVMEIIDMPVESLERENERALPPFSESIEFRDVTYTYPGASAPALDGVSLTIRKGERVAFVGPNGSGKTTLLSLLMRFFEPQKGAVLIDGRDVREHSLVSLRRQMSLITQDTVIFPDTIANNIAYGDDQLLRRRVLRQRHPERRYQLNGQDERIEHAARAAFADEFIREKPQGYDTYVGEHGATLSGGQKQRLAIARAILRNAPIFIFDEATSQVDSESEQKIHEAVERFLQGRTALIIAHRFSTILQADRIVVMDRGRIIDTGRHEELLSRCQLYQGLYGTQLAPDSN